MACWSVERRNHTEFVSNVIIGPVCGFLWLCCLHVQGQGWTDWLHSPAHPSQEKARIAGCSASDIQIRHDLWHTWNAGIKRNCIWKTAMKKWFGSPMLLAVFHNPHHWRYVLNLVRLSLIKIYNRRYLMSEYLIEIIGETADNKTHTTTLNKGVGVHCQFDEMIKNGETKTLSGWKICIMTVMKF